MNIVISVISNLNHEIDSLYFISNKEDFIPANYFYKGINDEPRITNYMAYSLAHWIAICKYVRLIPHHPFLVGFLSKIGRWIEPSMSFSQCLMDFGLGWQLL